MKKLGFKQIISLTLVFVLLTANILTVSAKSDNTKDIEINKQLVQYEKDIEKFDKSLSKADKLDKETKELLIEGKRKQLSSEYDSLFDAAIMATDIDISEDTTFGVMAYGSTNPSTVPSYALGYNISRSLGNISKWEDGGGDSEASLGNYNNQNGVYGYSLLPFTQDNPYSWTGYKFNITGSGKQDATFKVNDIESFVALSSYTLGGVASSSVSIKLFDQTEGSYVEIDQIAYANAVGVGGYGTLSTDGSYSITGELEAGHTYLFYVVTYGTRNGPSSVGYPKFSDGMQGTEWDFFTLKY